MKRKSYGTIVLKRDKGDRPNTMKGKASKSKTLSKLGLKDERWTRSKFVVINGIPHKINENGVRVPLIKKK